MSVLRRSELVALDVADLEETTEGLLVRIKRSKTDQEGAGDFVSIPKWVGNLSARVKSSEQSAVARLLIALMRAWSLALELPYRLSCEPPP
jgi:hypothetical protein